MDQKATFLASEGDSYFRRNKHAFSQHHSLALADFTRDSVLAAVDRLKPKSMLEVGCANGWRLDVAHQLWGIECHGVDPSVEAVRDSQRFAGIRVTRGTAVALPDIQVDCVIFGCVLCWCDRADLFRIAAEADRVLKAGGHIIAYEFFSPLSRLRPYVHDQRIITHKMDFSRLWSWHPAYTLWSHQVRVLDHGDPDDAEQWFATSVVKKG
jgi:SAM-dependent methyltransferase